MTHVTQHVERNVALRSNAMSFAQAHEQLKWSVICSGFMQVAASISIPVHRLVALSDIGEASICCVVLRFEKIRNFYAQLVSSANTKDTEAQRRGSAMRIARTFGMIKTPGAYPMLGVSTREPSFSDETEPRLSEVGFQRGPGPT